MPDGSRALIWPFLVVTVTICVVPRYSAPITSPRKPAPSANDTFSGRTPSDERAFGTIFEQLGHLDGHTVDLDCAIAAAWRCLDGQEAHWRSADEIGHEHGCRTVVDLLRRTDLLDTALIHDGNAVGHRHRLELVVGDVDSGRIDPVVQFAQFAAHQPAKLGIERTQRLVHQKRLGTPNDGAAERHPLPIAAGEAADAAVQEMIDPQQPRRLPDAALDLGARIVLALERKADVLAHVHVRVERKQLEHKGDIPRRRRQRGHVFAVEQNAAGSRQFEPRHHP